MRATSNQRHGAFCLTPIFRGPMSRLHSQGTNDVEELDELFDSEPMRSHSHEPSESRTGRIWLRSACRLAAMISASLSI